MDRALEEMERILQGGETDPYDFVFHGDLLVRGRRRTEAVSSYEEAISAYERVGLYRNAIAIGKKILRIDPERGRTHWRLGDLYAKEGLLGDAVAHFLTFLDRAGGEATGEEFLETLERVAELAGPRVEVALRLAELYVRAGRADRAACLLEEVADQAGAAGGFDIAMALRNKAQSLRPGSQERAERDPHTGRALRGTDAGLEAHDNGGGHPPALEPSIPAYDRLVSLDAIEDPDEVADIPAAAGCDVDPGDPGGLGGLEGLGGPCDPRDSGDSGLPGDCGETPGAARPVSGAAVDSPSSEARGSVPRALPPGASGEDDVAPAAAAGPAGSAPSGPEDGAVDSPEAIAGRDEARARIEEAFARGEHELAASLAAEMHEEMPDAAWPVEKLVAASRLLQDTLATIRYLTLLGDLKINEEDLEGSLSCFREVLELDPDNATAQRRLARFREMRVPGAGDGPEDRAGPIRAAIETQGATVSVREQGGAESAEWIDLAALLEEFRDGVRSQFRAEDYAGHYDLGVSHFEMGLFEEALEELDCVLATPGLPAETEQKTREMRGNALQRLERFREAIHEYRSALEIDGRPQVERTAVRYRLACALEAAGETEEARAMFRELAGSEGPTFLDTKEHLERLGG